MHGGNRGATVASGRSYLRRPRLCRMCDKCWRWRESYGDTGARAASQRRKKREARSKALHVELVLLRLWVCGRNHDAALVLVELGLLLLTSSYCKCCGEERARQERVPASWAGEAMVSLAMAA